ncbi:MAG TPA: RDD family protein, partial [Methylophilus sp.]
LYELLILIAIAMLITWLFIAVFGAATHGGKRLILQLVLWLGMGGYFVSCWVKSGQTLALQAWKLRIVNADESALTLKQACARYLLATLFMGMFGVSVWWALLNKQRLFLHDKLSNTKCISILQLK